MIVKRRVAANLVAAIKVVSHVASPVSAGWSPGQAVRVAGNNLAAAFWVAMSPGGLGFQRGRANEIVTPCFGQWLTARPFTRDNLNHQMTLGELD